MTTLPRKLSLLSVVVFSLLLGAHMRAVSTLTVCASGCTYTNTQLQSAVTAAVAGDTILLQEGFTYVIDLTLPVKAGAGPSAWVEIRSGVTSTGTIQTPSARYPAAGIRMCPSGFVQDWYDCSTRSPQDMTRIAKLQVNTNNAYGVRTDATAAGTPVSYYRFKWVEFVANTYGGNSIVGLTNDTAPFGSGLSDLIPHHFEFDQVVVRGQPVTGQFRGMQLDANYVTITNSMIYDIKAEGEGQALWANTSTGPFTITNNYVSGGTEVWLTGGAGTRPEPTYVVQASPAPTSTVFTLDRVGDLYVSKNMSFRQRYVTVTSNTLANPTVFTTATAHNLVTGWQVLPQGVTGCSVASGTLALNVSPRRVTVIDATHFSVNVSCLSAGTGGTVGVRAQAEIIAIAGNQVTVSPALPFAPLAGDIAMTSTVIRNATFRYNVFTRPASYITDYILEKPTGVAVATTTTGGTLVAGSYAYRVTAFVTTAQVQASNGGAAAEVSVVVPAGTSTNKNTITWNAVTNATSYKVYGRGVGSQTINWTVTAPTTTYVDTGSGGTGGGPSSTGSHWQVKNVFENKQGRDMIVEYNLIENAWQDGQTGPCVLFTGTQQVIDAESSVIRDVLFRYNVVRNCMQFVQITGTDALGHESARSGAININNNLFYNGGGIYGKTLKTNAIYFGGTGGGPRQTPDRAPFGVTFNHNTFHFFPTTAPNTAMMIDTCLNWPVQTPSLESIAPNTTITNNIFYNGSYGLSSIGVSSASCGVGTSQGRIGLPPLGAGSLVSTNVLAGGTCSLYNTTATAMSCPSVATLESATFTNTTTITGFAVKATSPYYQTALDGASYGADITTINTGQVITQSGDNSGTLVIPDPLTISTASPLASGFTGQSYTQTITGAGGTTPYTWSLTAGTLPPGLTFTPSTTTATITGTPTTAVTGRTVTVQLTDTSLTVVSKAFSIDVLRLALRASRYNWSQDAGFVQVAAPANPGDQVRLGDRWFDLTAGVWKYATALGPPIVFTAFGVGGSTTNASLLTSGTLAGSLFPATLPAVSGVNLTALNATQLTSGTVPDARFPATLPAASGVNLTSLDASDLASGTVPQARLGASGTRDATTFLRGDNVFAAPSGSGSGVRSGMFNSQATSPSAWVLTTTVSELFSSVSNRVRADLTGTTQCRIWARSAAAYANSTITMEYSTTDVTANFVTTNVVADLTADYGTNYLLSAYFTIPGGAQTETWLRITGITSSGTTSPVLRNVGFLCKP